MDYQTITDAEFNCRLYKCNWTRSDDKNFFEAARLVLVEGWYATTAAKKIHVHPVSVRRRCHVIANVNLTDSKPTYYLYSTRLKSCLGSRRTIKGMQHLLRCTLMIKQLIKRPETAGRILYPVNDDLIIYVANPDGTYEIFEK